MAMMVARLGRLMKNLDQQIAGAAVRAEAAKTQRSSATNPAVSAQWEEERRQAAAEEEDLRNQKADVLEFMLRVPGGFAHYLQDNYGCQSITEYLAMKYCSAYARAHEMMGEQFRETVEAAVFHFAEIERAWMYGNGHNCFRRSTALMTITGDPGCGTTAALLELIPKMRAFIEQHPERALTLVQDAAPGYTHEQHSAILQRLWASIQEGRELVCWLSMGQEPKLLRLETERDRENTLALRLLYGFIRHLDGLARPIAAAPYQDFLADMDDVVRVRLLPEHVYDVVERLTETGGSWHCFFLLLDDRNAVLSEKEGEAYATWTQQLLTTHLTWLDQEARGDRLVVPILGTTSQAYASMNGPASLVRRTVKLPLAPPMLPLSVH